MDPVWAQVVKEPNALLERRLLIQARGFFFFQAEDGIRDSKVTGVQTCALPILVVAGPPQLAFWDRTIEWRSADRFGSGQFEPAAGLKLDPAIQPTGLDDPQLALAARDRKSVV